MSYATIEDIQARMLRDLAEDEQQVCATLLEDAAVRIDAFNSSASEDAKKTVSCRMVIRVIGSGEDASLVPIGATQGTMSALNYSQSWTLGGSSGELYLGREDKQILGYKDAIGSYSPVEELVSEAES